MLTHVENFWFNSKERIFWRVEDVTKGSGPKSTYRIFESGEFDISATKMAVLHIEGVNKMGNVLILNFLNLLGMEQVI